MKAAPSIVSAGISALGGARPHRLLLVRLSIGQHLDPRVLLGRFVCVTKISSRRAPRPVFCFRIKSTEDFIPEEFGDPVIAIFIVKMMGRGGVFLRFARILIWARRQDAAPSE